MLSPDVGIANWPMKVPGDRASSRQGSFINADGDGFDGAVPLEAEAVNQLPPPRWLAVALQFKVPDPFFRI